MNLQSADSVSYFCPDKTTVLSADILAIFIKIRDETSVIRHRKRSFQSVTGFTLPYAEKKQNITEQGIFYGT